MKSLLLRGSILLFFIVWFYHVFLLVQEESEMSKAFDPYDILRVKQGTFDTPEIRKAYRQLAKEFHPDKANPSEKERTKVKF
jgi:preprotein translocase subunit Sec63